MRFLCVSGARTIFLQQTKIREVILVSGWIGKTKVHGKTACWKPWDIAACLNVRHTAKRMASGCLVNSSI
jgi:hypothetical protein